MTDYLFQLWFSATWQAIILALVVFLVTFLFRERLQPRWRYLLWCIVLLRLALPVLPETPWGIWNENISSAVPKTIVDTPPPLQNTLQNIPFPEPDPVILPPMENVVTMSVETTLPMEPIVELIRPTFGQRLKHAFLFTWFVGIMFLLGKCFWNEYRFRRQSRFWTNAIDPELLALFEECRKKTGVRRHIQLKTASDDVGAGCFGIFRPIIVLSESATKMNSQDLRMILIHELVHVKRLDPLVLRISTLLSMVHWPNPLVWFVLSRLQRERELACDAAVLHIIGQKSQKDYGLAILAFAELFPCREPLPGLVGIFEKNGTARRIDMIIKYKRSKWAHALLGMLLITLVAAIGLTRAQTQTQTDTSPEKREPMVAGETGHFINGIVVDSEDKPVANAVVSKAGGIDNQKTLSDQDGRFHLPIPKNLSPGSPFSAILPEADLLGFTHFPDLSDDNPVLPEIKIVLKKGRRVFGQVLDESGLPVSDAYVGASEQLMTVEPVLTDINGRFEFVFFQRQIFEAYAIKPGIGSDFLELEKSLGSDTNLPPEIGPLTLTLTQRSPIRFRVENAQGTPVENIQIMPRGLVRTSKVGNTTYFARFNVFPPSCSDLARELKLFHSLTDKDGNATIDWLPKDIGEDHPAFYDGVLDGKKRTSFNASDTLDDRNVDGRNVIYSYKDIYVGPDETEVTAILAEKKIVRGSVKKSDGTPVPYAKLGFRHHRGGNGWRYANHEGEFSIEMLPVTGLSVWVESTIGAAPTVFDASSDKPLAFELQEGTVFHGTVHALPDWILSLVIEEYKPEKRSGTDSVFRFVSADEKGNFKTRLPKGKFRVAAQGHRKGAWPPQSAESVEFEINDEKEKEIDFSLNDSGTQNTEKTSEPVMLLCTVDEAGKPLGKVDIRVHLPDFKDDNRPKITDEHGNMTLRLPDSPKELFISANAPGRVPQLVHWEREDMTSGAKIPDTVTFTLRKGNTIGGIVVDQDGKPIEGAVLHVLSRPNGYGMPGHLKPADSHILAFGNGKPNVFGGVTSCKTDRDGRWTLDNVPDGKFYPVEIEIFHPDFIMNDELGRTSFGSQNDVLTEKLRKGEYRFTMKRGISVSGTVRNTEGKPVKDALIVPGGDSFYYHDDRQKAVRTDTEGKYRLDALRFGSGTITVIAEGFAPDMKEAKFEKDMKPIDFDLKPGKTISFRFIDEKGKSIPKVQANIGSNPDSWWRDGSNIFNKARSGANQDPMIPVYADDNGIYRWDWAPDDKLKFSFHKEGFLMEFSSGSNWFVARQEPYEIVLHHQKIFGGTVVDAETDQPIKEYKIVYGSQTNDLPDVDNYVWQTPQEQTFTGSETFQYVPLFKYDKYYLRFMAEGYETFVSGPYPLDEEPPILKIVLKRETTSQKTLLGQVLLPDGKPAANAEILLTQEREFVHITPPNLSAMSMGRPRSIVKADGQGRFRMELPTDGKEYRLYAAHSAGFAQIDKAEIKDGLTLRLQSYGKLEIKIPYDTKPEAYNRFSLLHMEETRFDENKQPLPSKMFGIIACQGNIPPEGIIVIDNLIPGKYNFQKLANDRHTAYNVTNFYVDIQADQTKHWDLTVPNGVKITARIRLPEDYDGELTPDDWKANQLDLSTALDENRQWTMNYLERIRPSEDDPREGVVEIEGVAPGRCHYNVMLNKPGKRDPNTSLPLTASSFIGGFTKAVTIPEPTGDKPTVFDLGTIKISSPKPQESTQ